MAPRDDEPRQHPWRNRAQFATAQRRANVEKSYVPTIADELLDEADMFGVAHASAVDDAQEPGSHTIGYVP